MARTMSYAGKDLYAILEVSRLASPEVIHAAHRTLMMRYHPDRANGNPALESEYTERSKDLNEARRVLSDASMRREYDRERAKVTSPVPPTAAPQAAGTARPAVSKGRSRKASSAAAATRTSPRSPSLTPFELVLARGIQAVGTIAVSWVLLCVAIWIAWTALALVLPAFGA